MKFCSDRQGIYGMFLWQYNILTKTKTYLSLELNVAFLVIFGEKILKFYNQFFRNFNHNLSKWFCGINIMPMVLESI